MCKHVVVTWLVCIGNTCHLNSVLQALHSARSFVNAVNHWQQLLAHHGLATTHLCNVFHNMQPTTRCSGSNNVAVTTALISSLTPIDPVHWNGQQKDAVETLELLLGAIGVELGKLARPAVSSRCSTATNLRHSMHGLVAGTLHGSVSCSQCKKECQSMEAFKVLPLPIPNKANVSLLDCMGAFFAPDKLVGEINALDHLSILPICTNSHHKN